MTRIRIRMQWDPRMWILILLAGYVCSYLAFDRIVGFRYAFETDVSNIKVWKSVWFVLHYTFSYYLDVSSRTELRVIAFPTLGVALALWLAVTHKSSWFRRHWGRLSVSVLVPWIEISRHGAWYLLVSVAQLCALSGVGYLLFQAQQRILHGQGTPIHGVPPNFPSELLGFIHSFRVGEIFSLFLALCLIKAVILILRRWLLVKDTPRCLHCDYPLEENMPRCPECGKSVKILSGR